jgi:hypothetical protein
VDHVNGRRVALKGGGFKDGYPGCYNKLYYFGIGWGGHPEGKAPKIPTYLENDLSNLTVPGQWYYDRAAASIVYLPRAGEDINVVASSAVTSTTELLLNVSGAKHLRWEGIDFHYATWSGASDERGFVDTQAAYMYRRGEAPSNVRMHNVRNVTFSNCNFAHLGAVYAMSADGGSQNVTVSNCTFTDISGGAVKLGTVGERGAPPPPPDTDAALQDAGFLVTDNWIHDIPVEYHGAVPIAPGYVADTVLQYNTIERSSYSGIHVGWGWSAKSYARNIKVVHNRVSDVMQLLADGGCFYDCLHCLDTGSCSVSDNYFSGDFKPYGVIYHDGGSGGWHDERNVINHAKTACYFTHGTSPNTTIDYVWYNDTSPPHLQGATKSSNVVKLQHGEAWPAGALTVIQNAGRRWGRSALRTSVTQPENMPELLLV